jgi:hypothetical protein
MNGRALHITTAVIFILSVLFSGSLEAMNWPSESAALVRNFGANDRGKPVLGMVFNGGTEVLAAESGEVIFSRSENDTVSRLPSPLGAWTAVDHGDGLISIYSRYAGEDAIASGLTHVEKQQPIASSGVSGWSAQNGFYFIIFDRRERRWVNPAMIITPVQDTRPPQIISVDLLNAQGVLMQSRSLSQGRYTVLVNAAGGAARTQNYIPSQQYAPQRIVCSVNGAEAGSMNFEAVSARDGVLMVYRNGLVPAKQIYSVFPAFQTAEVFLTRGQATLEVIVQDMVGNSRSVVISLYVN